MEDHACQIDRVHSVLRDRKPHTLGEIQSMTGDLQQSIASRIRDLRLDEYGGHTISRTRLQPGVYAYRLVR